MRYFLWLVIWLLFATSLLGMLLSAILWSNKTRSLVVLAWIALADRAEATDLSSRVRALYEAAQGALLLDATRRKVSKRKTALIALAATALSYLGFVVSEGQFRQALFYALYVPAAFPLHWLYEYRFSVAFTRTYSERTAESLGKQFFHATMSGLWVQFKTWLLVFALAMLFVFAGAGLRLWLGDKSVPWWVLAPAVLALTANGISVPIMILVGAMRLPTFHFESLPFFAISLLLSFAAASLLIFIIWLSGRRRLLEVGARVLERTDAQDARRAFAVSMTLFAFATGCMQAYTFVNP